MSEADFEILDVIIDCVDPNRLGAFWAEVLGRRVEGRKGPYVWLERRAPRSGLREWRVSRDGRP